MVDIPERNHNYVFVLTQSERYFWDADAVREENKPYDVSTSTTFLVDGIVKVAKERRDTDRLGKRGRLARINQMYNPAGRNIRTVWTPEWTPDEPHVLETDMVTVHNTSAHDLHMIPDSTVQTIITSPPYYGLRAYAGEQGIEWPTVEYAPMPGLPALRIQGCEPGCAHEWVSYKTNPQTGGDGKTSTLNAKFSDDGKFADDGKSSIKSGVIENAYCLHCGGWRGALGHEPTPEAYIGHLILCLREWRRVLRRDGVLWVNLGDSYASGEVRNRNGQGSKSLNDGRHDFACRVGVKQTGEKLDHGLKPKDLLGIPWRFAFAAQADGWWLRSDVIWAKPNPMPESVTDRPTKAHEYVFVLTQSERYYWDQDAVKEPLLSTPDEYERAGKSVRENHAYGEVAGRPLGSKSFASVPSGRNIRTVWTIATQPYAKAHYAVWPQKLVEPMVKAATSERGACPACGAPWRRVVERNDVDQKANEVVSHNGVPGLKSGTSHDRVRSLSGATYQHVRGGTIGWQPTCGCRVLAPCPCEGKALDCLMCDNTGQAPVFPEPVPCVVLDPFAGSGTTGRVAVSLGRAAILCDVSGVYLDEHVPERTTVQIGLPQL